MFALRAGSLTLMRIGAFLRFSKSELQKLLLWLVEEADVCLACGVTHSDTTKGTFGLKTF